MTEENREKPLFNVVIPIAEKDVDLLKNNLKYIKQYIMPKKIVIITSRNVREKLPCIDVDFIDEDKLIDGLSYRVIYEILKKKNAESRAGWYFQQFLKYAYANVCEEEYYLTWDADTIPLKKIEFFNKNTTPIFSLKKEYNKPYFDTIKKLLGYDRAITESFIAEHMMFKKDYILELIQKISKYNKQSMWFKNILDSICEGDIAQSGFSEFETYGTFVYVEHPDSYCARHIKAFRNGQMIFEECPNEEILRWIAKKYETISFEKSQRAVLSFDIYKNPIFRNVFSINGYLFMFKVLKRFKK